MSEGTERSLFRPVQYDDIGRVHNIVAGDSISVSLLFTLLAVGACRKRLSDPVHMQHEQLAWATSYAVAGTPVEESTTELATDSTTLATVIISGT